MNDIALEFNHVWKKFKKGEKYDSLRDLIPAMTKRLFSGNSRGELQEKEFWAVKDVSFEVKRGEALGIIGPNGAGKSTILKLLSGILRPNKGDIKVNGRMSALIEVGAGFHPDLTGRENIYLNGAILGMKKNEIDKNFDEIVEFSGIPEFIDTPVKRYSSGMYARLGFSVAAHINPDILIVDEVLGVGDMSFQRKCFDMIEQIIKDENKCVVLVSHNIRQIQRICDRVILLDEGKIVREGPTKEVCDLYYALMDERVRDSIKVQQTRRYRSSGEIDLLGVSLMDQMGNTTMSFNNNSDVIASIRFKANIDLIKPIFAIGIHTTDFLYIATHRSAGQITQEVLPSGIHEVLCTMEKLPILPGVYSLRLSISAGEICRTILYAENVIPFQIVTNEIERSEMSSEGLVLVEASWRLLTAREKSRDT